MKIGIINTLKKDSPLATVYTMICQSANLETAIYQADTFTPQNIEQDNLNCILMYGATETDDGLAKAIHKHSNVPILYYLIPGYGKHNERYDNLNNSGIEVYHVIKTENYRGSEDLIERLKQLGKK